MSIRFPGAGSLRIGSSGIHFAAPLAGGGGGALPPSLVQSQGYNSGFGGWTTSRTISMPAAVTARNSVVLLGYVFSNSGSTGRIAAVSGLGATWQKVDAALAGDTSGWPLPPDPATPAEFSVWLGTDVTGGTDVTVTNNSTSMLTAVFHELTPVNAVEAFAATFGSGTSAAVPPQSLDAGQIALTLTSVGNANVGLTAADSPGAFVTNFTGSDGYDGKYVQAAHRIAADTETAQRVNTINSSQQWAACSCRVT